MFEGISDLSNQNYSSKSETNIINITNEYPTLNAEYPEVTLSYRSTNSSTTNNGTTISIKLDNNNHYTADFWNRLVSTTSKS